MLDMISIFLNLLMLVFYSIFENVPCAFEKIVYFASLGWKALYISVKYMSSRALFKPQYLCWYFVWKICFWQWGDKIPYYNCVSVDISLVVLQDFPYIFGSSYVGCIYIYYVYVFWMDSSLEYYEVFFWVSFYGLCFESVLSDKSIATLAFFSPGPLAWNIRFQPFTFRLRRPFALKWVSHRQHMYGS